MADVAGSKALAGRLRQLVGEVADLCSVLEPEDLLASDAGRLVELSGAMDRHLAGARTLAMRRVLQSGLWRDEGARSPQRWLAATLGITVSQAARIVATAERVCEQPKTEDALRRGELSDDEADAVSGATEADPDNEEDHLAAATGGSHDSASGPGPGPDGGPGPGGGGAGGPGGPGPGGGRGRRASIDELRRRRERAKAKADQDAADREQRLHRERRAHRGPTSEGGYEMRLRTNKAAGLRFDRAWNVAMDELRAERQAQGLDPLTYGQLAADALIRLADKSLDAAGATHGTASSRPQTKAFLFADLAALRRGSIHDGETCEIPGVGPVPVATARDLLGDATLTLVIRDGIDVLNVTNLGRTFTAAQRAAIWARAEGRCEIPGCGTTTGLEIDHDHEVQFGGPSAIANASLKCWSDHQAKTHQGMRLIGPPGRRAWIHVSQLPADPARGQVPLDDLEHLLPPPRPTPAGPAPPTAGRTPGHGARRPDGEQLHLLAT